MVPISLTHLKWQKVSVIYSHQLEQKISPASKRFTDFLKRPNPENFIITNTTTTDEIGDLINSFESSKSVGPYGIPTKIMTIAKGIIS